MRTPVEAILAILPASQPQVASKLGMHYEQARRLLRKMSESNLVHIGRWEVNGSKGRPCAVYYAGPGVDAQHEPMEKTISDRLGRRRTRARKRAAALAAADVPADLEPTVSRAMRTQPNSIWALAAAA